MQPRRGATLSLKTGSALKPVCVSVGELCEQCDSSATFIVRMEAEIVKSFELAERKDIPGVAVLCNGLQAETKAFAAMLVLMATIPRRGRFLIVLGLRRDLLENALMQWEKIREMRKDRDLILERVRGYRSFVLACEDFSDIAQFGDTFHHDATVLVEPSISNSSFELSEADITAIYQQVIEGQLRKIIERAPVRHPNRYYLIENKYYTQTFYEIGKVVSSELASNLAVNFFRLIIQQHKIGAVFTIPEPLFTFSERLKNTVPGVRVYNRDSLGERSAFFEAIQGKENGTKLLILTDVICTANEVQKFVSLARSADEIVVGCFVDGREDRIPYLVIKAEDRAQSVSVLSLHTAPIKPIFDLPGDVDTSKILIVDPKTHAPTAYDHIQAPEILPGELLEKSIRNKSLYYGHLCFGGKHYSAFLFFARLFDALRGELHSWWNSTFDDLRKRRKIQPENIAVLYLDEKRGWEKLVPEYMSTKGVKRCERLTKEELDAPPEPGERQEFVWFILPAMASGDTAMLCLEYGARVFQAREINISIIVARIDSGRLSFYQNITAYRDCSVKIRALSCLPITAYSSNDSCPLCAADKLIEDLRLKISSFEYMSGGIARAKDLFRLHEIVLEELGPVHPKLATERDRDKALLAILYQEAIRSVEHRKSLVALMDKHGASLFLEMVGNEFLSDRFSSENYLKRAMYNRYSMLQTEAARCSESTYIEELSRNFARIAPPLSRNFGAKYEDSIL